MYEEKELSLFKKTVTVTIMLVALALITTGCFGGTTRPLGWSGVTIDGDNLYFVTREGTLFALNSQNGIPVWQNSLEGAQGAYGSPLVVDDTIYVVGYSGKVYALNTAGTLKWTYPFDNKLPSAVAYHDGLIIYGSDDGNLYAHDAGTGARNWEFSTGAKIWATPVVADGVIYFGSFDKHFYAVEAETGQQLWSFKADGVFTAPAVVEGDTVIIGSLDRNLYAIDRNTGKERWSLSGDRWFWTSVVVSEGTVFAPNTDSTLYAVNLASGSLEANYEFTAPLSAAPVLINGKLVIAAQDGTVSLLDIGSGQITRITDLGTTVRAPLAVSGDVVFVHSQTNETIYALNTATGSQIWFYDVQ
jgi:outer membrane protein assembly factor BamB